MATQTEVTSRVIDGIEYPPAGTYVLDTAHTRLGFAVRHMAVSKVRGGLNTFEGTLVIGEDPLDSTVEVAIDATSVDTRDEARDNHLRSNDFFDVENHPKWTFVSTAHPAHRRRPVGGRRRPHHPRGHPAGHPPHGFRGSGPGSLRQPSAGLHRDDVDRPQRVRRGVQRGDGGRRCRGRQEGRHRDRGRGGAPGVIHAWGLPACTAPASSMNAWAMQARTWARPARSP